MTLDEFQSLRPGHKVTCINSEGWRSFVEGGTYTVTGGWPIEGLGVVLDGHPVAAEYHEDFEVYEQ